MKGKFRLHAVAAALAALAMGAPAYATGEQQRDARAAADASFDDRELRNGLSLNRVLGMDVRGRNGQSLGEVQNVIVTSEGRIAAIVVETGGFMNIGDRHFRVPFKEARFSRDMDHVVVPLTEQSAQRYRDRRAGEQVRTGPQEYRVSRLKDGAFWLSDGTRAGNVEDLIATRNGTIKAVVVDTDFGPGGLRSVPFDISRFDFEASTYNAPYARRDVTTWAPWDYGRTNVAAPRAGGVGATGDAARPGAVEGGSGMRAPRQSRG